MAWFLQPQNGVSVINNVVTNDPVDALSAAQGAALQAEIVALQALIDAGNDGHTLTITANGQTAFTLPTVPKDPASVALVLNGQVFSQEALDFSVSGSAITWLNAIPIASTDTLVAWYQ